MRDHQGHAHLEMASPGIDSHGLILGDHLLANTTGTRAADGKYDKSVVFCVLQNKLLLA